MTDRYPADVVALAIAALAHIDMPERTRLCEVAGLAIAMNSHAESYRAAEVDEDEIEAGCRTMGEMQARLVRMDHPGRVAHVG